MEFFPKHDVLPLPWPPLARSPLPLPWRVVAVVASGFSISFLVAQFKPWSKARCV